MRTYHALRVRANRDRRRHQLRLRLEALAWRHGSVGEGRVRLLRDALVKLRDAMRETERLGFDRALVPLKGL